MPMIKNYVFFLDTAVGVALSGSTSYYGWTPEHEFTYRFESQVLSGIPEINNQYSGLKLSSEIIVQSKSDYSLIVKIVNPKFIVVNQELQVIIIIITIIITTAVKKTNILKCKTFPHLN